MTDLELKMNAYNIYQMPIMIILNTNTTRRRALIQDIVQWAAVAGAIDNGSESGAEARALQPVCFSHGYPVPLDKGVEIKIYVVNKQVG